MKGREIASEENTENYLYIPFSPKQVSNHIHALLLEQDKVFEEHPEKHFSTG